MHTLRLALKREFDIDNPRIVPHLDAENYKTYDAVLTADREQGLKDFLELSQGNGVAYTTRRELICTAPFSAESFRESIYLAKDILKNRERYDEARSNPLPKLFIDKKEDNKKRHEPN
jgi:4-hydroxythreonine-4-phosphate dehydrogenase